MIQTKLFLTRSAANIASLSLNSGNTWPVNENTYYTWIKSQHSIVIATWPACHNAEKGLTELTDVILNSPLSGWNNRGTDTDTGTCLPLSWSDRCLAPLCIWAHCGRRGTRLGSGKGFCSGHLAPSVSGERKITFEKKNPKHLSTMDQH